MKVAIIGLSQSCREGMPGPDEGWQRWVLAWDTLLDADLAFEMHEPHQWGTGHVERYLDNWAVIGTPIMMHQPVPCCPTSIAYPFASVLQVCPDDFQCSITYMLGLAIARGAERVGIWGVAADEGYIYQRPNIERFLGIMDGRKIPYWIHPSSALQKPGEPGRYGTGKHTGDEGHKRSLLEMWGMG